jgi:hypothetical protein
MRNLESDNDFCVLCEKKRCNKNCGAYINPEIIAVITEFAFYIYNKINLKEKKKLFSIINGWLLDREKIRDKIESICNTFEEKIEFEKLIKTRIYMKSAERVEKRITRYEGKYTKNKKNINKI